MTAPRGIDWAWATRTGGALSAAEKRRLIAPLAHVALRYPAARLKLAAGRRGPGRLDLDSLVWPDSRLARDATEEAREVLSAHVLQHSYRTYLFGLLLAQRGRIVVDHELMYITSMLHDTQLEHPTEGRCFAVVGGERAERFCLDHGADAAYAAMVGAGVAGHITVGAADDLADPAGFVSAGAFADLTGFGLQHGQAEWVDAVHARYPRLGFRRHLLAALHAERRAMPTGRIQWLSRYGAFMLLIRAAPFAE